MPHKDKTRHVSVPKHARVRKFHHRNRGGCYRCRERHIRCDQAHPRCLACTRLGLNCEWSPSLPRVVSIAADADALRSFQFYRENTMFELQGYHEDGFWNGDLLRMSYRNRDVEQLVIALSSLDEAYSLRTRTGSAELAQRKLSLSLSRYQSAIEGLRSRMCETKDIALILTSCVVCACIEIWHGAIHAARRHVQAGYTVALTTRHELSRADLVPSSTSALPILWRLGQQMAIDEKGNRLLEAYPHERCEKPCTYEFADIVGARTSFYATVRFYACRNYDKDPLGLSESLDLVPSLDRWFEQFKYLGKKCQADMRGYHLLAIHYYTIRATVDAVVLLDESLYDEHIPDFEQVIAHCHNIMLLRQNDSAHKINSARSADASVMMALLFTTLKCRSPLLRRSALRLLYRCRRLEGVFAAVMIGTPAEQLMSLEEEACTEEELRMYEVPSRIRRLSLGNYVYEPGILQDNKRQDIFERWADEPPFMKFEYRSSYASGRKSTFKIRLKPFISAAGFGMKSTFWYPISCNGNKTIYDEEIPLSTRSLDGSHFGHERFAGRFKDDLRSLLCMQYMSAFEDLDVDSSSGAHRGPSEF